MGSAVDIQIAQPPQIVSPTPVRHRVFKFPPDSVLNPATALNVIQGPDRSQTPAPIESRPPVSMKYGFSLEPIQEEQVESKEKKND
ncbi:MAG: hypothetical protein K1X28_06765 [Parachlamydiales bacterium]|nr:hypothetical protein [Parachlamydiales bacterium]